MLVLAVRGFAGVAVGTFYQYFLAFYSSATNWTRFTTLGEIWDCNVDNVTSSLLSININEALEVW